MLLTVPSLPAALLMSNIVYTLHRYQFDTPFEKELKQEVFKIVRRGREFGTFGWHFRAVCYVTLYVTCLYFWIKETSFVLGALFGLVHALIGLNVQHDGECIPCRDVNDPQAVSYFQPTALTNTNFLTANHGAASRKPFINDFYGFGVDAIGGSKWLWMEQHWFHHA
jgi:fatty acid desaturase (delta-4 desaturase)